MDGYYAWMLMSSSLVLMMTAPALALFYGGMSRSKSVLNMMMMSFSALGVVGIVYMLWGWSMSYSTTIPDAAGNAGKEIGQFFSSPFNQFGLENTDPHNYVFVAFQLTFAVITAALISGAIADRVKFSSWLVFLPLWITLSYFPLAHMVWGGGFLSGVSGGLADMIFPGDGGAEVAPIDYAGGTVVHINAGVAGLVLVLLDRQADRLRQGADASAQPDADHDRCRAAVVRLVRLQRRLDRLPRHRRGRQHRSVHDRDRTGLAQHHASPPVRRCSAGCCWRRSATARPPRSAPHRVSSPVWLRSPRRVARCRRSARSPSVWLPVGSAPTPSASSTSSGMTTRSTSWASTSSAESSAPSVSASSPRRAACSTATGSSSSSIQFSVALFAIFWSAVATLIVGLAIKYAMGWRIDDEDEVEGIDSAEHAESAYDLAISGGGSLGLQGSVMRAKGEKKESVDA